MKTTYTTNLKRRSFLKGVAVTGVAASAGATTGNAAAELVPEKKIKVKQGYTETKHVKEYYRLARF